MNLKANPSTWYREPLVWMLIAIPFSSVVMGAVTLFLAISTFDGMVSDDYYEQGLQINRSMERDALAEDSDLSSVVLLGARGGVIEVRLAGNARFKAPELVNLRLFHATRPGLDVHSALRRLADGRYLGGRPDLAPGRWYLQLDADGWRLKGELEASEEAQRLALGRGAGAEQ